MKDLEVSPDYVSKLKKEVVEMWNEQQQVVLEDNDHVDKKIADLREQASSVAKKIRFLSSEISIRYMEKDLLDIEAEIQKLEQAKEEPIGKNEVNIEEVMEIIGFYLEHLEELLLHAQKPLKQAEYFSLLFEETPTYDELRFGTPKLVPFISKKKDVNTSLVRIGDPMRNRTAVPRMRTWCPNRWTMGPRCLPIICYSQVACNSLSVFFLSCSRFGPQSLWLLLPF